MRLKITITFTDEERQAIALSMRKVLPRELPNPVSRSDVLAWVGEQIGRDKAVLNQLMKEFRLRPDPNQLEFDGILPSKTKEPQK